MLNMFLILYVAGFIPCFIISRICIRLSKKEKIVDNVELYKTGARITIKASIIPFYNFFIALTFVYLVLFGRGNT